MIQAVELGAFGPNFFGYEQRLRALVALARSLWLRGYSSQALTKAQEAMAEASTRGQPVSVCMSLYVVQLFLWTGDLDHAANLVDRLIEHAELHSLNPYRAVGIALKGELAVARGEVEIGIELLREALETIHSEWHNLFLAEYAGSLSEGLRRAGHLEEALLTINAAIRGAVSSGSTSNMAELLRLKAEVLAVMQGENRAAALECLKESLKFAREQSALAYELRSATTLARLLAESGQRDEARKVLGPVYGRFTEGFDTIDLRDARTLLTSLA